MSDASQQGPLGPAAAGVPAAQLSVSRNGDVLTASATVPFSLRAVIPRAITILVVVSFLSYGWRAFSGFGHDPSILVVPLLWLLIFSASTLGTAWGLAMAFSGRVTVTFDRSQIAFVQEAFGMRRAKSYGLTGVTGLGVKTGRLPGSVAQQARFDGVTGTSRPGSCLALRRGWGTVALFPGMPQSDLFSLLGQVRAHYAMLGVDVPFAEEQPAESAGAASAIDQARTSAQRPPVSVGDDADPGFWDDVSDAVGKATAAASASAAARPSRTVPGQAASTPPFARKAPPSVATGPTSAPSSPPPVAVTSWSPAKRTRGFSSEPGTPPLSDRPVYDPEAPPR